MSRSVCRACGVRAVDALVLPLAPAEISSASEASAEQTCVHTCRFCGDQRVSVWRLELGREEHVNIHPCASSPDLRQVGRVRSFANGESTITWTHYVDDIEVTAQYWKTRLADRRMLRRALVSN